MAYLVSLNWFIPMIAFDYSTNILQLSLYTLNPLDAIWFRFETQG